MGGALEQFSVTDNRCMASESLVCSFHQLLLIAKLNSQLKLIRI